MKEDRWMEIGGWDLEIARAVKEHGPRERWLPCYSVSLYRALRRECLNSWFGVGLRSDEDWEIKVEVFLGFWWRLGVKGEVFLLFFLFLKLESCFVVFDLNEILCLSFGLWWMDGWRLWKMKQSLDFGFLFGFDDLVETMECFWLEILV